MAENVVTIFGTCWCGDCLRVRRFFERNNILYDWVDIDLDENGEEFVLSTNNGMRSVPTVVFDDGVVLVEPSEKQLRHKLETFLNSSRLKY
jgi:mycoredoxin